MSLARTHAAASSPPPLLALGAVVLALVLQGVVAYAGADNDDALITFRYAARIAAGEGFTYGEGARVLGTTTPLFTLLLAGLDRAGVPPPAGADALNVVFGALAAFLLARLAFRASGGRTDAVVVVLAVYLTAPLHLRAASYGMEAPLFSALVLAALESSAIRRPFWAGTCAGLSLLTRPEGALLLGALAIVHARRPRDLALGALGAVLVVGPWVAFAWSYFGSPIPNSVRAKLAHDYGPSLGDTARFLFAGGAHQAATTALGLAGGVLLVRRYSSIPSAERAAGLFAALYAAFYLVTRPVPYEWYLPPLHLAFLLVSARAIAAAAERLARFHRRAALALPLATATAGATIFLPYTISRARIWRAQVEASYVPLARFIDENSEPGDRIFTGDIGYVGYLTGRPILDASGLVSPRVVDLRRSGAHPNALIKELAPELLVFPVQPGAYPVQWPDRWTEVTYRPIARFPVAEPVAPLPSEAEELFRMRAAWRPDYVVYARVGSPRD